MRILGISAYYHDAAAALVVDGRVEYAAQEERFTRRKHDPGFPHQAVRSCLEVTGFGPAEIDLVAFYDKPFLKFERLLETYLAFAPRGFKSLQHGDAHMAEGEAVSEKLARPRAQKPSPTKSTGTANCCFQSTT